jgi:predicted nucleic acid-binding protein
VSRFVVDACVAVKWSVSEIYSEEATRLLNANELLSPDFLLIETANVFLKKIRTGEMVEPRARMDIHTIAQLVDLRSAGPLLDQAMSLALTYQRSFYDSLYVALALQEGCQMVTADQRLYNALHLALPDTLLWIGDLPEADAPADAR